jgi:hypothetical protein
MTYPPPRWIAPTPALLTRPMAAWPPVPFHVPAIRKSALVAWLLWALAGWLGAHRYYLGRWLSGTAYLATFGLLGIGVLVDLFLLPVLIRDANTAPQPVVGVGQPVWPMAMPVPVPVPVPMPAPPPPTGHARRCSYCDTRPVDPGGRVCDECGAAVP